jgi:Amt family ammonium transporter
VDDNDTNLEILDEQMSRWGIQVAAARSADEGLQLMRSAAARGEPFDVAILDRQMPQVDGLDLARLIKSDERLRNARLLMLTSLNEDLATADAESLELKCLHKPVRQSLLFDTLIRVARRGARFNGKSVTQAARTEKPSRGGLTHSAVRVLIADDNEINQIVAAEILRSEGYVPSAVRNGREAVEAARSGRFDLVLMDCEMPEMDGFAATREIRAGESSGRPLGQGGRPIPIIALTAQAVQGDRQRCLDAGMDDYVTKPIDRLALLRAMRAAMPQTGVAATAAVDSSPADVGGEVSFQETLNVSELRERSSGDDEFITRILTRFQEKSRDELAQLSLAAGQGDTDSVARIAHSFKGAAGNVGAVRLKDAATDLETAAKSGSSVQLNALCERMESELAACETVITALLGEIN